MQRPQSFTLSMSALLVALGSLLITTPVLASGPEKVLYNFCSVSNCADGQHSWAALIFDSAGNLYGTTAAGGSAQCSSMGAGGCGTVFKLSRGADGQWTETVLYTFCSVSNCTDGANPFAPLIFDSAGNLYGTTAGGGTGQCYSEGAEGCGTVFELTPSVNGPWTETVLHSFCSTTNCADGAYPYAGLILDSAGDLYGTTADTVFNSFGGCYPYGPPGCGKVFGLRPGADGRWTYRVLHNFEGKDGAVPEFGSLIFDAAGNLYGTTNFGGRLATCPDGCGTVFELTPGADDQWTEKVLYRFDGIDGNRPLFGLVFDTAGNLYGTAYGGGDFAVGTVFRLSPAANGQWKETLLHSFNTSNGSYPASGLIMDGAGNLYGNTNTGGANDLGTVFRLSPGASGKWKQTLYSFQTGGDGAGPTGNVVLDSAGNLYGTTFGGGTAGPQCDCGTVYEITP
jgi:uncharacterized repeat protein (TIGR03803 family)